VVGYSEIQEDNNSGFYTPAMVGWSELHPSKAESISFLQILVGRVKTR
jgi:hypothetical protein